MIKTMTISNNPLLLLLASILFFLLLPSTPSAINITETLSSYPDLSIFNHYLTKTHLADKINNRTSVTILAVGNHDIAPLAGLSNSDLESVMSVHVLYDYYDVTLFKAQVFGGRFAVPNLLRYTQKSYNKIGYVHVTLVPTGAVYFSSAEPGSKSPAAMLVKSVVTLPVNISVLQISAPVFPLSLQKDGDEYDEAVSSTFARMTKRYSTKRLTSAFTTMGAEGPATPPAPKSPEKAPKSAPSPKSTPSPKSAPAPAPKSPATPAPAPHGEKSAPSPAPAVAPPTNPPQSGPTVAPTQPPTPGSGPAQPPAPAPGSPHSGPAAGPPGGANSPSPRSGPAQAPTPFPSPRSGPVPAPGAATPPAPESSPETGGPASASAPAPAPSSITTPVPAPAEEPAAEEPTKSGGVRAASVPGLLVAIVVSSIIGRLI